MVKSVQNRLIFLKKNIETKFNWTNIKISIIQHIRKMEKYEKLQTQI